MLVIQCSRATAKISIAKISSSTVCRAEYSHEYYFHETWSVFRATSVSDNLVNNVNPYKMNVTSTLTIIIQPHRQLSHTHDKNDNNCPSTQTAVTAFDDTQYLHNYTVFMLFIHSTDPV